MTYNQLTTEQFIEKAKAIYGNLYDYSKVEYVNARTKICIVCPKHGEFWQTPDNHLHGHECPKCMHRSIPYTTEEFIERAKQIHGNKYDYSKSVYETQFKKICIICQKHGEFWQRPKYHLRWSGCPRCKMSHLEDEVYNLLKDNNIDFRYDVRNFDFLNGLTLDFYLPDYNIAIECQGIQHFEDSRMLKCDKVKERDKEKKKLCEEKNIKMLYYSDLKIDFPYEVINNKNELLNKILINDG